MNSDQNIVMSVPMDVMLATIEPLSINVDCVAAWFALQSHEAEGPIDRIFKPPQA